MNEGGGDKWEQLRRAYAPAKRNGEGLGGLPPPAPTSARPGLSTDDDLALRQDLAEERAAIMEFEGGLPRREAEALAYRALGLEAPRAQRHGIKPR